MKVLSVRDCEKVAEIQYSDKDEIGIPYAIAANLKEGRLVVASNHAELRELGRRVNIECNDKNTWSCGSQNSTLRIKVADIVKLIAGEDIVNDYDYGLKGD